MNRNLKWHATNGSKRPRRQCYQLLPDSEGDGSNENSIEGSTVDCIKLHDIKSEDYIEKVLDPGETLLTLSLKFNCPVAELKRVNHILRDNEIYARRKIKVPIKPGSFVSEKLAGVHLSNGVSKSDETIISSNESLDPTSSVVGNLPQNSVHSLSVSNSQANNEVKYTCISTSLHKEDIFLEVNSTNRSCVESEEEDLNSYEVPSSKCSGADWGISWLQLVICALLLGFAGPLLYILLMTEKKH